MVVNNALTKAVASALGPSRFFAKRIGPSLALLLAFSACIPAQEAQNFSGKVVHVKDGDSIMVLRDCEVVEVRLAGIDCPEKHQAFWESAKEFTEKLALEKEVKVTVKGTDWYKRGPVGEVMLPDGKILNRELLKAGLAWWYEHFAPHNTAYEQLEKEARKAWRGLWPMPPWENRKGAAEHSPKVEEKEATSAKEKQEAAVYITKTGKKYHRASCSSLSHNKVAIPLEKAKARYAPCSVCKPPT
jgi:endonuclease YncB( thermonuclease family)